MPRVIAITLLGDKTILLPCALFFAAAAVLAYAMRRRRIDDHPICRRCGFDLFGKPETSNICSECGADLARRRAIRVGHFHRRTCLAFAALVPMFLCGSWLGTLG